ncbi:MAG: hypothetical protein ACR2P3_11000 [Geminicoccaceae bacterium]
MMGLASIARVAVAAPVLVTALWLNVQPALAFCVRNDTGVPIRVEALDGTADFLVDITNNKKACCRPKDENCAIGKADVRLSITASESDAACAVTVDPKGNINVTGNQSALKCKANKAGSTMDWASG